MDENNRTKINISGVTTMDWFQKYLGLLMFTAILVFFALSSPYFLKINNISNVLRSVSVLAIVAFGVCLCTIVGEFDISFGFVAGLSSMFVAGALRGGQPIVIAILIGILTGTLFGLLNGFIATRIGLIDMVTTLSTGFIANGIAFTYSRGYAIYEGITEEFAYIGRGYIGFIPIPVVIILIIFFTIWFMINSTKIGKYMQAVGGSPKAAFMSGINTVFWKSFAYIMSGTFAGIAGVLMTSILRAASASEGPHLLLDGIAAVFLGQTLSLKKAKTAADVTILGTFLGVLFIGFLDNGLTLLGFSWHIRTVIKGIMIILALSLKLRADNRRVEVPVH
jgi:ribose transport system permease protein